VLFWIPLPVILSSLWESSRNTRPRIPPEYAYLANLPPINKGAEAKEAAAKRKRLVVVLLILAVVMACIVFLLPALAG
jgi:hypothetical protein